MHYHFSVRLSIQATRCYFGYCWTAGRYYFPFISFSTSAWMFPSLEIFRFFKISQPGSTSDMTNSGLFGFGKANISFILKLSFPLRNCNRSQCMLSICRNSREGVLEVPSNCKVIYLILIIDVISPLAYLRLAYLYSQNIDYWAIHFVLHITL